MHVRPYTAQDYENVTALYKDGNLFGGQFDLARDSVEKMAKSVENDPEAILVCEGPQGDGNKEVLGTVSLIENGRVAWLFRFAVADTPLAQEVSEALYQEVISILKGRGHEQVLVYSDPQNEALNARYKTLGMSGGSMYRCFWVEV